MTPEEKEDFERWKTQRQQTHEFWIEGKKKLDRTEPVAIPIGYVIAGGIALTALVVASFPILLVGVALGAFAFAKLSSHFHVK